MRRFRTRGLPLSKKDVPLQCVFHSIRFKVNKGWSTAVLLFLCPYSMYPISWSSSLSLATASDVIPQP